MKNDIPTVMMVIAAIIMIITILVAIFAEDSNATVSQTLPYLSEYQEKKQ